MSLKDKMERFNKRWDVTTEDSYTEAFTKFKTRILNILCDIDDHLTEESIAEFCQFFGIKALMATTSGVKMLLIV